VFDPFEDFDTRGYLRNTQAEKDPAIIKILEHELFRAQLPTALDFLSGVDYIGYEDFLKVHEILFQGLYPWAGQDRQQVLSTRAVRKGDIYFCHPMDCRRAVEDGLRRAQALSQISASPGFIMGMFAYGHPFLDGNGRTMLLVHAELCFRAGMSIDWHRTEKGAYLEALTRELDEPTAGHLDAYLKPFIGPVVKRETWLQAVTVMPGLDGAALAAEQSPTYSDPAVVSDQKKFETRRNYRIGDEGFVPGDR